MIAILSRNWWAIALRGLVAILFGVITLAALYGLLLFAFPAAGSVAIVWLIAAYAIIFGILLLLLALRLLRVRNSLAHV